MKFVGFFLLALLLTLSLEVQELQAAVRPLQLLGTCMELCRNDWDCAPWEICGSRGCNKVCVAV
ncbi:hypothetical protein mRhiFer1_018360 [Rhinolophus ferrumequinum]|uniref:WAP domain-containing protein n=1 Tax=Rhinolophus ferrumequinum TaxID=59479 RepID=A0A671ECQ0_RHIFE|nr:hypothetical protein mRhiFer1_018360 [Rhinolophus ferrumequinum]